ncbi:MAG: signal peptidase I [Patescibacteria group bacterium]
MLLKRLGAFFLDIIEVIVFAVAIFLFVYLLILQPHKIKGASMDPNFPDGEYLLTDKVSYRFGEPKRGDVIVFKAPTNDGEEFIKRIIGLPSETVKLENSKIYINGKALEEPYIKSGVFTSGGSFLAEGKSVTVPEDEYLVLGDNRPHSSDSRAWGFVPKKKITGRAWLIYWPPKKAGLVAKAKYNL